MNTKDFQSLNLLKDCTLKVLEKCKSSITINANGKDVTYLLHVPSGDMKYGSFWIRDAAMMAESGLISAQEIKDWLSLIALKGQNGPDAIDLENGLVVPPWAIADHINFDGGAVFFPGTYNSGSNQGNGTYGIYPPHDDQYYFIEMAHLYYSGSNDISFFTEKTKDLAIIECLEKAFEAYNIDKKTQLCTSGYPGHTVDWGFCDSIAKSGYLLFPSLLRYRAALRLSGLFSEMHDQIRAKKYSEISNLLKENISSAFYTESGWFVSATDICRQNDIWGTAFAVWLDILDASDKKKTASVLLEAYKNCTSINSGYVRHILEGENASENSAWEKTGCKYNTYQNGGYWATPTGWYAYTLSHVSKEDAVKLLNEFVDHTVRFDNEGAPFEWRSIDDTEYSGLYYGTSAALPYAGFKRILAERGLLLSNH